MSNLIICVVIIFIAGTSQARSWSGVGNGGFIIECNDEQFLFDYYESEQKGLKLSHQIPGETLDEKIQFLFCLLYTSPSPRDQRGARMPSSA